MKQGQPILEVSHLSTGNDKVTINHSVSLKISAGEIIGIIGESGCGKSTFLRSLLLLNESDIVPFNGSIRWKEKDLLCLSEEELGKIRGREISIVFQSLTMAFDPLTKIKRQYLEVMECHGGIRSKQEALEKLKKLLRELKLEDPDRVLNAYPFELSGGMTQRAALVMALLNDPELILADEVTSALDVVSQNQVIETMREIRDLFHTAILFVTHNMHMVEQLADQVAVMYGGRIVEQGRTDEVLRHPGHPYTAALIAAVPKTDGNLPVGIKGGPPPFQKEMPYCPFAERCPRCTKTCLKRFPERTDLTATHFVFCCCPENSQERISYGADTGN